MLERDGLLAQLDAEWQRAAAGSGRLVFVEGEAGIGKTTLLRAFAASLGNPARVLWGACDALLTPRPLGPLEDIAAAAGGTLKDQLERGAERHKLFVAFVDALAAQATLVVLEDLHWADEATLDLLRYAGRRIGRTRSLLVASLRSDELVPSHPLRGVLGDLATLGALRLEPRPLSPAAVRTLCAHQPIDVAELHRKTAGNPFFVTEVLAAGGDGVPASVQDAVLARSARLSVSARAVLDAAAVAGPRIDVTLLREMVAAESEAVDECVATGVLCHDGTALAFRHELARQAVLQALTPGRAMSLHRLALHTLMPRHAPDAARLAHHADGAGETQAVLHWSPVAAREAAQRGAHRQAAESWGRALRHAPDGVARAPLLDAMADELQMSGSLAPAIDARRTAARLWQDACENGRAATSLARLALHLLLAGRYGDGEAALHEARALVAPDDAGPAGLAVQCAAAGLRMMSHDCAEAIELALPALANAERNGDRMAVAHLSIILGAATMGLGRIDDGLGHFARGLAVAESIPSDVRIGQVLTNLGASCAEVLQLDNAESALRRGMAFCGDRDLDAMRLYQLAWMAHVHLLRGRWDDAAAAAAAVIGERRATTLGRMVALIALGRLRARRGDPGVWAALDEAQALANATGVVQRIAPAQAARAEAAWLEARYDDAAREAAAALPLALAKRQPHHVAELTLWSLRAGAAVSMPVGCTQQPAAVEAASQWRAAADAWLALGCPYEAARALADGDAAAQREALTTFERLGARPLAERVRHRLRAAGVRGLPRGPRRATAQHPAGLTAQEKSVLELLSAGLRNKEIAQRLSRSPRTVEHHVQAIFAKLHVATRAEAVSAAHAMGIVQGEHARPSSRKA